MDVCYKLWEGSWQDDAVVRDGARTIHRTRQGARNRPPRPILQGARALLCEPSPQRTPVLFQAGVRRQGRRLAAEQRPGGLPPRGVGAGGGTSGRSSRCARGREAGRDRAGEDLRSCSRSLRAHRRGTPRPSTSRSGRLKSPSGSWPVSAAGPGWTCPNTSRIALEPVRTKAGQIHGGHVLEGDPDREWTPREHRRVPRRRRHRVRPSSGPRPPSPPSCAAGGTKPTSTATTSGTR